MRKILNTILSMYVGFTLGILSASVYSGYMLYELRAKKLNAMKQRMEITIKLYQEDIKQTLEGSMLDELKDKRSYLEIPSHKFDLDEADILKYHKGDNRLVVYIQDVHKEEGLQKKIYGTVDELKKENGIDLLVLENFPNKEVTKEELDPLTFLDKILNQISYGFWTPKNKDEAIKLFDAGLAYEYINGSKIEAYGAEDEDLYDTSIFLASRIPKSDGIIWLHRKVILEKRSEMLVKNTIQRMKKTGKDEAIFICGAGHTKSLLKNLEKEGVSYIVIQPKGLDEKLEIYRLITNF